MVPEEASQAFFAINRIHSGSRVRGHSKVWIRHCIASVDYFVAKRLIVEIEICFGRMKYLKMEGPSKNAFANSKCLKQGNKCLK